METILQILKTILLIEAALAGSLFLFVCCVGLLSLCRAMTKGFQPPRDEGKDRAGKVLRPEHGYQPTGPELDVRNPPKGGSGLKAASESINEVNEVTVICYDREPEPCQHLVCTKTEQCAVVWSSEPRFLRRKQ
jgi:hypothetical protein